MFYVPFPKERFNSTAQSHFNHTAFPFWEFDKDWQLCNFCIPIGNVSVVEQYIKINTDVLLLSVVTNSCCIQKINSLLMINSKQ